MLIACCHTHTLCMSAKLSDCKMIEFLSWRVPARTTESSSWLHASMAPGGDGKKLLEFLKRSEQRLCCICLRLKHHHCVIHNNNSYKYSWNLQRAKRSSPQEQNQRLAQSGAHTSACFAVARADCSLMTSNSKAVLLQQVSSELTSTSALQSSPVFNKAVHHSHWFQI